MGLMKLTHCVTSVQVYNLSKISVCQDRSHHQMSSKNKIFGDQRYLELGIVGKECEIILC